MWGDLMVRVLPQEEESHEQALFEAQEFEPALREDRVQHDDAFRKADPPVPVFGRG